MNMPMNALAVAVSSLFLGGIDRASAQELPAEAPVAQQAATPEQAPASGEAPVQEGEASVPEAEPSAEIGSAPTEEAPGIEEIVVRARRVEEKLQDVPLSITAFNPEQLEAKGIENLGDATRSIPSLVSAPATGRKSASTFGIRGQKADDPLLTQDQAVGIYVGGVPLGWSYGIAQSGILDIASFEVDKGPQGTLFGKNTTGGAIVITPRRPQDVFDADVRVEYGNYDAVTTEGMVNLPLAPNLALRAAAAFTRSDGVIENHDIGDDFNGANDVVGRLSMLWKPGEAVESLFVFDGYDSDTDSGVPVKLTAVNAGSPIDAAIGTRLGLPGFNAYSQYYAAAYAQQQDEEFFSAHTDEDQFQKARTWGFSNITSFDATPALTLKNIASISRLEVDGLVDLDGANADAIPLTGSFPDGYPQIGGLPYSAVLSNRFSSRQITEAKQITEEFQVIGKSEHVDLIGGFFYSFLDGKDYSFSNQYSESRAISGPEGGVRNESVALFGQGTYHLTDAVNLTAGLRYTRDQREIVATSRNEEPSPTKPNPCLLKDPAYVSPTNPQGYLPADACEIKNTADFGEPTWTVSADWKLADHQLLYVAHRKGYRSGTFSGRGTTRVELAAADPEIVLDYEIGYKSDFRPFDRPLRFNVAVFLQDYEDIQRNATFRDSSGQLATQVTNAASATVKGGEVELTFYPSDALQLSASYALVDAAYDKWNTPNPADPGETVDRSDNKFAGIPRSSFSADARYTLPLPGSVGEISVAGNVYHQGRAALYVDNAVDNTGQECEGSSQDAYTLLNARLDWRQVLGIPRLSVAAWGKNIGDEEYYTSGLCLYNQTGFSVGYPGDPPTYGLSIGYRFGD